MITLSHKFFAYCKLNTSNPQVMMGFGLNSIHTISQSNHRLDYINIYYYISLYLNKLCKHEYKN